MKTNYLRVPGKYYCPLMLFTLFKKKIGGVLFLNPKLKLSREGIEKKR
jgi:hypothetical protein